MADTSPQPSAAPAARVWRRRALRYGLEATAISAVVVVAGVVTLYGSRYAIGRTLAESWLAEHGIESAVEIEHVDAEGFVGRLRLGPANDPVLTADRIEVDFDLAPFWSKTPFDVTAKRIRLVRPRAKISYDGKRLSLGALDPLLDELLSRPKTDKPAPDIFVEDGQVRLATPYGLLVLDADAVLDEGRLVRADGTLAPTTLKSGDLTARLAGAEVHARGDGGAVDAELTFSAPSVTATDLAASDLSGRVAVGGLRYDLAGGLKFTTRAADAKISGGRLVLGEAALARLNADISLGELTASADGPNLNGTFDGSMRLTAASAGAPGSSARDLRVSTRLMAGHFGLANGKANLITLLNGEASTGAVDTGAEGLSVRAARTRFEGRLAVGRTDAPLLALRGSLSGQGGMTAEAARDIGATIPADAEGNSFGPALERALTDLRLDAPSYALTVTDRPRLTFGRPITLTSGSGVRATIDLPAGVDVASGKISGSMTLAVRGGGLPDFDARSTGFSFADGVLDGQLGMTTSLDIGPAENLTLDADGRLRLAEGGISFTAGRCARIAADRLVFGETEVVAPRGEACPQSGAPLFSTADGAWRASARLAAVNAGLPGFEVTAADGAGELTAGGGKHGDVSFLLDITGVRITDTTAETRFNPVNLSGPVQLDSDQLSGDLVVRAPKGEIGRLSLRHDLKSGAGRVDIDASRLQFAENGLQPKDISPLAAIVQRATGPASFTGSFTWTPEMIGTGEGRVSTPGLDLRVAGTTVVQVKTDIAFTSLTPLVTAPDQVVTANLLQTITEFEEARAVFDLASESLKLDALALRGLGGALRLDPMVIPFDPNATVTGALIFDGVELGDLLDLSNLGDKISADAKLDGRLPFQFGPDGFKFLEGEVHAREPGRLAIRREALTGVTAEEEAAAGQPVNAVQDFAYQAMENLAFDELSAAVKSLPGGRLGILFHIKGEHDPEKDEEIRVGIRELLSGQALQRRLPLPKGTPVDLTLDTSLNFDELLKAYRDAFRGE